MQLVTDRLKNPCLDYVQHVLFSVDHARTRTRTHIHTCTRTHIHTCTRTRTRTHTLFRTRTLTLP